MKDRLKNETIEVKGMHCINCVKKIEGKLSMLKGIESAKADLVGENVHVQYDPEKITIETVKDEIAGLGYVVDGKGKTEGGGALQGIMYGLIPHTGCILFIAASVLGVTVAAELFKPLLMNPYIFYILIAMSVVFATISSILYLKNQGFITVSGGEMKIAKNTLNRKWKYLTTMYGSTVLINVFLFFFVFPALANIGTVSATGAVALSGASFDSLSINVAIPCPGHAPLISSELKKINGVVSVRYSSPNLFQISYDGSATSESEILALDVFDTYKATVYGTSSTGNQVETESLSDGAACGCGSGCTGSCGCSA